MFQKINEMVCRISIPSALRVISLAVFGFLVYIGLQAHSTDAALLKELRNTNLGNLFVWSFWWPLIIIGAVFFGRIWCFVCPVELATSLAAKVGLRMKRPGWLLSGWAITAFYTVILFVGIQVLKIHRDPAMMALYLLSIVGVSIITGLVFEKNTFCRYVCPVGFLLGLYARISPIGFRVKDADICKTCRDKSCIRRDYTYNLSAKSCGVDLYPAKIEDNTYCILCTGCRKTCGKYNPGNVEGRPNPGFTRVGFAHGLFTHRPVTNAEAFFLMIVSGFVISEILSEWSASNMVLNYLPGTMKILLEATGAISAGIVDATVLFLAVPAVVWGIPCAAGRIAGSRLTVLEYLRNFGVAFIPLMAAAHLCKAVLKMSSRIPYLPLAFNDPAGMETARSIVAGTTPVAPLPGWAACIVTLLLTVIMAGGVLVAVKTVKTVASAANGGGKGMVYQLIPATYGGIFAVTIVLWRYLAR